MLYRSPLYRKKNLYKSLSGFHWFGVSAVKWLRSELQNIYYSLKCGRGKIGRLSLSS